jgi:hypothetical protein
MEIINEFRRWDAHLQSGMHTFFTWGCLKFKKAYLAESPPKKKNKFVEASETDGEDLSEEELVDPNEDPTEY